MDKHSNVNTAEKQRLRESIAEQVRNFLASGGRIDVLDDLEIRPIKRRGSVWYSNSPPFTSD